MAGFSEGAGEGLGLALLVDGSAAEGVGAGGDAWEQGGPVGVGEAERPRCGAAVGVESVCAGGLLSKRSLPLFYHFPGLPHDRLQNEQPQHRVCAMPGFERDRVSRFGIDTDIVLRPSYPIAAGDFRPTQSPRPAFARTVFGRT